MSPSQSFVQNIIALVWDFDKTLSRDYMQKPLFKAYEIDESQFWEENNQLANLYAEQRIQVNRDTCYLNHILSYIRLGKFKGLNNHKLRELGAQIEFNPGIPEFLKQTRDYVAKHEEYSRFELRLEHYIVSTGLSEMIRGSQVMEFAEGIWGCEFIERPFVPGETGLVPDEAHRNELSQIACTIDNTTKTKALFEINKGANKHPEEVDVNQLMGEDDRRVPFRNMIYIADGPSDVPAFSLVKKNGGKTFAVYREYDPQGKEDSRSFDQAETLRQDGRVDMFGPADYQAGTITHKWLFKQIDMIAQALCERKRAALGSGRYHLPKHIIDK